MNIFFISSVVLSAFAAVTQEVTAKWNEFSEVNEVKAHKEVEYDVHPTVEAVTLKAIDLVGSPQSYKLWQKNIPILVRIGGPPTLLQLKFETPHRSISCPDVQGVNREAGSRNSTKPVAASEPTISVRTVSSFPVLVLLGREQPPTKTNHCVSNLCEWMSQRRISHLQVPLFNDISNKKPHPGPQQLHHESVSADESAPSPQALQNRTQSDNLVTRKLTSSSGVSMLSRASQFSSHLRVADGSHISTSLSSPPPVSEHLGVTNASDASSFWWWGGTVAHTTPAPKKECTDPAVLRHCSHSAKWRSPVETCFFKKGAQHPITTAKEMCSGMPFKITVRGGFEIDQEKLNNPETWKNMTKDNGNDSVILPCMKLAVATCMDILKAEGVTDSMIEACLPTEDVAQFKYPSPSISTTEPPPQSRYLLSTTSPAWAASGEASRSDNSVNSERELPHSHSLSNGDSPLPSESDGQTPLVCVDQIPDLWVWMSLSDAAVKGFAGRSGMVSVDIAIEFPEKQGVRDPLTFSELSGDLENSHSSEIRGLEVGSGMEESRRMEDQHKTGGRVNTETKPVAEEEEDAHVDRAHYETRVNEVCKLIENEALSFADILNKSHEAQFQILPLEITNFVGPSNATAHTQPENVKVKDDSTEKGEGKVRPINRPNMKAGVLQHSWDLPELDADNMLLVDLRVPRSLNNISLMHLVDSDHVENGQAAKEISNAKENSESSSNSTSSFQSHTHGHGQLSPASLYLRLWDVTYDEADVLVSFKEHPANFLDGFFRVEPFPPPTPLRLSTEQKSKNLDDLVAGHGHMSMDGDTSSETADATKHRDTVIRSLNSHGVHRPSVSEGDDTHHASQLLLNIDDDELFWTIEVAYPSSKHLEENENATKASLDNGSKTGEKAPVDESHIIRLAVFPKSARAIRRGRLEVYLQPSKEYAFSDPAAWVQHAGPGPGAPPLTLSILFVLLLVVIFLATVAFGLLICLNEYGSDVSLLARLFGSARSNDSDSGKEDTEAGLTQSPRQDTHVKSNSSTTGFFSSLIPKFMKTGGDTESANGSRSLPHSPIRSSSHSQGNYTRAPLTVGGTSDFPTVEMTRARNQRQSDASFGLQSEEPATGNPAAVLRNKFYLPLKSKIDEIVHSKPWQVAFHKTTQNEGYTDPAITQRATSSKPRTKYKRQQNEPASAPLSKHRQDCAASSAPPLSSIDEAEELEGGSLESPLPSTALLSLEQGETAKSISTMASPNDEWKMLAVATSSDNEDESRHPTETQDGYHKACYFYADTYESPRLFQSGQGDTFSSPIPHPIDSAQASNLPDNCAVTDSSLPSFPSPPESASSATSSGLLGTHWSTSLPPT